MRGVSVAVTVLFVTRTCRPFGLRAACTALLAKEGRVDVCYLENAPVRAGIPVCSML